MKEVSFIVTVYNMEKYLNKCLDSIVHQNYQNFEVIMIDDCSTDGSARIMEAYESKYDMCRVVKNAHNVGLGSSRYIGLHAARGQYLVYIDADDWIHEAFSYLIHEKIKEQQYDVIYTDWDYVEENDHVISEYHYLPYLEGKMTDNKRKALFASNSVNIWGGVYHKEFLEKWQYCFIEGQNYDEDVIALLYPLMAENIGVISEVMYHWLRRKLSMSNKNIPHYRDRLRVAYYFYKNASLMGLVERYPMEIEYGISFYCYLGMIKAAYDLKEYPEIPLELMQKASCMMHKYFPNYQKNKYLLEKETKINLIYAELNDEAPEKFMEAYYSEYAEAYLSHMDVIKKIISYCERKQYTVAIWGGGKKGRTFLRFCDPMGTWIKYVLDSNEALWGKKIGFNHTVYFYDDIKERIDIVIVMNTKHYIELRRKIDNRIPLIDLDNYIKYGVSFDDN